MVIDDTWAVRNETGDEDADYYLSWWLRDFNRTFGTHLKSGTEAEKYITLRYKEGGDEFHSVEITEDGIMLCGAGLAGLIRALSVIFDSATEAGGACFNCASFQRTAVFSSRVVYSYNSLYAQVFDAPSTESYSDELLYQY